MEENFIKANKTKLRFNGGKGQFTVEDLFDLSLTDLDRMAQAVNKALREEGEESFLPSATRKASTGNGLRLDILKYVIQTKVAEQDARKVRADKAAQLSHLKELAASKSNEEIAKKSLEEILKQIAGLEAAVV